VKRTLLSAIAFLCATLLSAAPPRAADAPPLRTVKIRVAADETFRRLPDWQDTIRQNLRVVSGIYERQFRIRFDLLDIVEWSVGGEEEYTAVVLSRLRQSIEPGEADLLIGLTNQRCLDRVRGGTTQFGAEIVILAGCNDLGLRVMSLENTLSHEIAHVFGAFHVRSHIRSIMNSDAADAFDPQTTRVIDLFQGMDFRRGITAFTGAQLEQYETIWRDGHRSGDLNPVALAYAGHGQRMQEFGRPQEAIDLLKKAIEIEPKFGYAHELLGIAYKAAGDRNMAITAFKRALELEPKLRIARIALIQAQSDAAGDKANLAVLQEAVKRDPNNSAVRYELARALLDQGRTADAEEHLLAAVRASPSDHFSHTALGILWGRQGRVEKSVTAFRRAIQIRPDYAPAHASLGYALALQGEWADAVAEYKEALRLNPGDTRTQVNLRDALNKVGTGR
jgi:tetratricopeptide (TPR) repeat protein